MAALKEYVISIKGPLTTPVGGGIRSLNVTLRQELDLFVCLRPIQYFTGVPSPVKHPEKTDMTIFRENTEDIYAGIEWESGSDEVKKVVQFLSDMGMRKKIRFPETTAIGIKTVSIDGSKRLIRKAIQYAIDNNKKSVTITHKGNIMKFTEGGFRDWGYALAKEEFGAVEIDGGPWCKLPNGIVIKDCIADAFLQEILLHPEEYDVVAALNLNGDYISDALAAQVGGIGIAPGANLSNTTAMFEATHGTAPNIAGKNIANPSSLILSAEMMLRHMGWTEAADLILSGVAKAIQSKRVTGDFSSQMDKAIKALEKISKDEKYYDGLKAKIDNLKKRLKDVRDSYLVDYKEEVKTLLEEQIVSRYYLHPGSVEASLTHDLTVQTAAEVLKDETRYNKLLAK